MFHSKLQVVEWQEVTDCDTVDKAWCTFKSKFIALVDEVSSGRIPEDLKAARITPVFKKNSKTEADNYRPVSILSIISKII